MRTRLFMMLVLIASLVIMCSKDKDSPTNPGQEPGGNNDGGTPTSLVLSNGNLFTRLPDQITIMFQVTDLNGKGADFLTLDRFQITEEGQRLNNQDASAYVLKKSDLNYSMRTKILIDNDAGTNLAALKKGALQIVQRMDRQQEIAVYTIAQSLTMVSDFTNDANALTEAINSIQEAGETCNLYDGIMKAKRDRDEYALDNIVQYTYVLFTDSNDEVGSISQDAIGPLTSQVPIYTVGYGSVDGSLLDDIGVAYYSAADEAAIEAAGTTAQTEVLKIANSLYQLSYRTTLRGGSGHILEISVTGNTNTESSAVLESSFSSSSFVDVQDGLYVNWSYSNPEGIDLIMIRVGTNRTVELLSKGGAKQPNFTASSQDPGVASVIVGSGGLVTITAKGVDGDSTIVTVNDVANSLSKNLTVKIVTFQLGTVMFEKWENTSGTGVTSLTNDSRYPDSPTSVEALTSWEIPSGVGDNYGTRIRGYLHPATSGDYTFYIASDDQSQLFLSTDGDPANKRVICEVTAWTNSREWGKEANQKSDVITLEAGKHYYIETIHIEGTGGDNLAVAWQLEGGTREVISGDFLSYYLGD